MKNKSTIVDSISRVPFMVKRTSLIIIFLISLSTLNGQDIENGTFEHSGCNNYGRAFNTSENCVPNWSASHGTPDLLNPNGDPYVYTLGRGIDGIPAGEGLFGGYIFEQGTCYNISYSVRTKNESNVDLTNSTVHVKAATGLVPSDDPYAPRLTPDPTTSEDINSQNAIEYINTNVVVETLYCPDDDYNQFWLYMSHSALETGDVGAFFNNVSITPQVTSGTELVANIEDRIKCYPNLIDKNETVTLEINNETIENVSVFNTTGKQHTIDIISTSNSQLSFKMNGNVDAGIYFVKIHLANGQMATKRLMVFG